MAWDIYVQIAVNSNMQKSEIENIQASLNSYYSERLLYCEADIFKAKNRW